VETFTETITDADYPAPPSELDTLRIRVGEMAAEIERLQGVIDSINSQQPAGEIYSNDMGYTSHFRQLIGGQLKIGSKLYLRQQLSTTITEHDALEIATQFFYWWHNQPGKNTMQGFGEWIESDGRILLQKLSAEKNG
jgi:hypothetical protein